MWGCGRHMVVDSAGSCPGGGGKRSRRSLPLVPRIRQTIGKLALAAATRTCATVFRMCLGDSPFVVTP